MSAGIVKCMTSHISYYDFVAGFKLKLLSWVTVFGYHGRFHPPNSKRHILTFIDAAS